MPVTDADCGRKNHPFDGVCAPAWVEKLSMACSRGDCAQCLWVLCSCPVCHDAGEEPEPADRWKELREEIRHLRTAAYDVATSLCDEGRTISAERAFGKTDALDQVLALMAHTSDEKG